MRRASDAERERLNETFAALCRIRSPTGEERDCAEWIRRELSSMGLEVTEHEGPPGSNVGNLLARVPPRGGGRSILLCTHMDTVPPLAPIEPVVRDGGWENAHEAILGADNKAAVAVAVELARRLTAGAPAADAAPAVDAAPAADATDAAPAADGSQAAEARAGVELLFTVAEETGLQGAKAFDVSQLTSEFGYVLDHASPIGEIVLASPTYHRITAEMIGHAAHAGIRPEEGRSAIAAAARAIAAMPLGRLDAETTANVGTIRGGTAANVVPERCLIEAEVRSLDEARVEAVVTELIDHLQDAAGVSACDVDVDVERMFRGYRTRARDPMILLAEEALASCGYTPRHIVTGGGSDANALQVSGFPCANLANGTERNHEPEERVSVADLEGMLEVMLALVEHA